MAGSDTGPVTQRSTLDLVVLIFAGIVALVILGAVVMLAVLAIQNPEYDTRPIIENVYGTVTTILGSLIGLIAGQAKGRADARMEALDKRDE